MSGECLYCRGRILEISVHEGRVVPADGDKITIGTLDQKYEGQCKGVAESIWEKTPVVVQVCIVAFGQGHH